MNEYVSWLNQNQGVLAAIPIVGGVIFWLIKKFRNKSKLSFRNIKSQSVVVFGSHNYVEGQSIDTETEIELNPGRKYIGESKGSRIIAKITSSKNRITEDCFLLDCFGENFLLSLKDLKEECLKTSKRTGSSCALAVALLKKFYGYLPNEQAIVFNKSFYSALATELIQKNIVLEIQTIEEVMLKIPFHLLTESNFNISHNCLSVNLTRTI